MGSFFFGRIGTEPAGALVRAERGLFLLRMSSAPGCLTVTVGLGQARVHHYRIGRSDADGFVVATSEGERHFCTLREALECGKAVWGLERGVGPSPYRRALAPDVVDPYGGFCK